ncbi:MAG: DegT/DnrJ/EryC1/StrS family aminotransferase [Chloroflexi bacterium]|nr:MAG: DegT/DnrJ/EryC1/StrS family aminotransferase [Chloroflexota bacterium]
MTEAFRAIVRDAAFVGGPEVDGFEREFAAFCHADGAVGVASGTDALRFAYLAMGIKPGDEVITVPNTFIATTEALTQAGASVRFVDVLPDTLLMDPKQLAAAITPRTVGIVPVHLYGTPVDMDSIEAVAQAHGLWVIEDAAQAHGATYKGRHVGTMGAMAAFSFYPGKNLGACGEAGAITSSDAGRLAFVRKLREHGQAQKYFHDVEGYNGRLDALQAAFLRIKLRHLDQWNHTRRSIAARYRENLSGVSDVRIVAETPGSSSVYHLFVVRVPERDRVREFLQSRGIATGLHYPLPLHQQVAYRHLHLVSGAFPVSEGAAAEILSLPMYPEMRADHVDYVSATLIEFFAGRPSRSAARVMTELTTA